MKNRWLLGIAVLVLSVLGCDLLNIFNTVKPNMVSINTVAVTPSIGSGSFTLHVDFRLKYENQKGETIHCYYVTLKGGTVDIGDLVPAAHETSKEAVFTVTQPGLYTAGCQTGSGASEKTTFTVSGSTPVTQILSVAVSPPSGSGNFEMKVEYKVFMIKDQAPQKINCTYLTPRGTTVNFDPITPTVPEEQFNTEVNLSASFPLIVLPQADGTIEPGEYKAACVTEQNSDEVHAYFTVIEAAKPLIGRIKFDYNGYQSSRPSGAGELDVITSPCIPMVTVSPDGVVSGDCEQTGPTTIRTNVTTVVHVTGTAERGRKFDFRYEATEKFPNGWGDVPGTPMDVTVWSFEQVRHVVYYTGTGNFTSATQASGEAYFDFSCDTGASNLIHCWKWAKESFSGTLPWSFEPSP